MSNDTIAVELQKREVIRKKLAGLRSDGQVPAVIHNHGKESIHVMGDFQKLTKVYSAAGKHHPVELTVDGKKHLALIKGVDFEPARHRIRHIVFQAIKQNEKVSAEIPVVLEGEEIPAERQNLLVLTQLDTVEVEALPKNLPDQLTVDATKLAEVGDHLYVSDIKAPEGVTILSDLEASVAVVEMPKDQIAEADAAAAALADDAAASASDDDAADDSKKADDAAEESADAEQPAEKSED